jgi:hypothetical protein
MLPSAEGCAAQLMKSMPLIELLQQFLGLRLRRATQPIPGTTSKYQRDPLSLKKETGPPLQTINQTPPRASSKLTNASRIKLIVCPGDYNFLTMQLAYPIHQT